MIDFDAAGQTRRICDRSPTPYVHDSQVDIMELEPMIQEPEAAPVTDTGSFGQRLGSALQNAIPTRSRFNSRRFESTLSLPPMNEDGLPDNADRKTR